MGRKLLGGPSKPKGGDLKRTRGGGVGTKIRYFLKRWGNGRNGGEKIPPLYRNRRPGIRHWSRQKNLSDRGGGVAGSRRLRWGGCATSRHCPNQKGGLYLEKMRGSTSSRWRQEEVQFFKREHWRQVRGLWPIDWT